MISVGATLAPGAPPKMDFDVDQKHSSASGAAAMEWGQMMWKNMLG
jgi:hypothetical protein